ncbi:MAG: TorF family putative porin [Gallionella sp.]
MMKSKLLNTLMLAALAVPSLAMAADAPAPYTVSSNIGLVSNYIFRGITQNVAKPAVQGGMDLTLSNGIYAGVWGSNVGWITGSPANAKGNASLEMDTYAGYRGAIATDYSYDVGLIRYNYLGDYTPPAPYVKADTAEAYGSIAYQWISVKYSYALGDFLTVANAKGTSYLEVNANYAVGDSGFTLLAHYGKQKYKGADADALVTGGTDPSYSDYKLGVTKDLSGYVVGLAYTNTNAKSDGYYTFTSDNGVKKDWGKSAVALSLTHAM